ncbi:MAG TPA: DUF4249 family protein [Robiginitalea sp.]|nr:DUF4249 family protein [Robiginitalea sp.]
MKRLHSRLLFFFTFLAALGCEDVIEVDLPAAEPRLIVEGLIRVDRQEAFLPVRIRLRESAGFFEPLPATQAEVVIIYVERFENGEPVGTFTSSLAEESPGSGVYIPDPDATFDQRIPTFFLEDDVRFTLQIRHRQRQYLAETWYQPVVPIDYVLQGKATLQTGEETEVIVGFTDPPQEKNYYLFDFGQALYLTTEDTFYQGQFFQFSYFYEDPIEPGTELTIGILGADKTFYNYMRLLIEQSELEGPFQTPVASARGNVLDVTGIDNIDRFDNTDRPGEFPLGYFAVVQQHQRNLTVN